MADRTPKHPTLIQTPWKNRFDTLVRRKSKEDDFDLEVMTELDIMTENLRHLEVTPTTKKSFSLFEPNDYHLEEGENRSYLDPKCLQSISNRIFHYFTIHILDEALKEVVQTIRGWLNDSLGGGETRIVVTDLEEDIKDGMVLKLLLEKYLGQPVRMPCGDFVQSRERQEANVDYILTSIEGMLGFPLGFTSQRILAGELYPTLDILIKVIRHFQNLDSLGSHSNALPDLPKVVKVSLLKMCKRNGALQYEKQAINLMGEAAEGKRDGFDTLIDHAPEKLHFVKESLIRFSNSHLAKLGYPVTDLESDFSDGVRLILLMGSLEGYFLPFFSYKQKPENTEDRMANVSLAFKLMEEAGLPPPRNRPSELVHRDLKSVLRVVYSLFIKYKN